MHKFKRQLIYATIFEFLQSNHCQFEKSEESVLQIGTLLLRTDRPVLTNGKRSQFISREIVCLFNLSQIERASKA